MTAPAHDDEVERLEREVYGTWEEALAQAYGGVWDPAALAKITKLERRVERLRAELKRSQQETGVQRALALRWRASALAFRNARRSRVGL